MRLSRKTRYGLLFLSKLKANYPEKLISLSSFAKESGVSPFFLKQIAADLKKDQIITSKEGIGGGYTLSRSPQSISFKEVLLSLEGPLEFPVCADQACPKETCCSLSGVYKKAYQSILGEFEKINLGDLGK